MAFTMAYASAGLDQMATPLLESLKEAAPESAEVLVPAVFHGRDPYKHATDAAPVRERALRRRLEQLFLGTNGSGSITVREQSGNGRWSYKVEVSTSSGNQR